MQILLSGLHEQASRAWAGAPVDGTSSLEWQPVSLFIADAETAVGEPGRRWVWLYRAPWVWLAEGSSANAVAALQQWQSQQRAVLQLRRSLKDSLVLVNVDRVDAQFLAEYLGIFQGIQASSLPARSPLASTLASLFSQAAPECWALYEALEAAAWLPEGEPEFRSSLALPSNEGLDELLQLIHAGRQLPRFRQRADELGEKLQAAETALASVKTQADFSQRETGKQLRESEQALLSLRHDLDQARTAEQTRREEHELLLAQLLQVQEELERQYLDNVSLKEQHAALAQELTSTIERHADMSEQLELARAALTEAKQVHGNPGETQPPVQVHSAKGREESQSLREENELLLNQLHSVQEKLENYYLANREILSAVDQSEHTMHRARHLISQMAAHV
ncbi:hypothetical protein [Pseudomonas sp. Marseille-QA0332]